MKPSATTTPSGSRWLAVGAAVALGTLGLMVGACAEDPPESLYVPDAPPGARPVLSSIAPPDVGLPENLPLAGVTTLTLTGQNFSPTTYLNVAYFNQVAGTVLEATPTQLRVKAPNVPGDSVLVRVAVAGVDSFSAPFYYKLSPAAEVYAGLDAIKRPLAVTCDAAGNVYVSLYTLVPPIGLSVHRLQADTLVPTPYSPIFASSLRQYLSMKFGPGGYLYLTARQSAIYRIPPGGGASTIWVRGFGGSTISDIDFDQSGTLWAGGNAPNIFRVRTSDGNVKSIPFVATVRSVRVYQNNLYVGGKVDTVEGVWRFPIVSADSLGTPSRVVNFSASYPNMLVNAITFTAAGELLIGTDASPGIVEVKAGGAMAPLYPGLLAPKTIVFAYSPGVYLYATRELSSGATAVYRINMQRPGAPYYGIQ